MLRLAGTFGKQPSMTESQDPFHCCLRNQAASDLLSNPHTMRSKYEAGVEHLQGTTDGLGERARGKCPSATMFSTNPK